MRQLAEVWQRRPLRIVSVIIGDDTTRAEIFADHIIRVDDLPRDREQLRSAVGEIV